MMVYIEHNDPLYHQAYFADEILVVQDYVKQALYALKNAETHASWNNGVTWRGHEMKFPKTRSSYDFWMQKIQHLGHSDPMFSDQSDEPCLDINVNMLMNFFGPLRMNMHQRLDIENNCWETGWIIDPAEFIAWTTVKFIHKLDGTVGSFQGQVQFTEIMSSRGTFGYGSFYGDLNQIAYERVLAYIADNNLNPDTMELIRRVSYPLQPDPPAED